MKNHTQNKIYKYLLQKKIENLKEVKDYYLYERGWIDSDSMVESLIDFIIYLVKE